MTEKVITGRKVFVVTAAAFAVIIAVNVTLAVKAVQTFPGLEVKNSYVASQTFDADRAAQVALGWDVTARVEEDRLILSIRDRHGRPVELAALEATLGRATHLRDDQSPDFRFENGAHIAAVDLARGNWNLRIKAAASDGTPFQQRIVINVR